VGVTGTFVGGDGRVWTVERKLALPRWWKLVDDDYWQPRLELGMSVITELPGAIAIVVAVAFVALLIGLAIVVIVLLPLLILVGEAALLLLAMILLRGRWIFRARTTGPPEQVREFRVRGWRRSRRATAEIADLIRSGVPAPS
jgi:hypothetical protein